ncbi:alpha/beta fold hydrolase [Corynebacterium aquatimens]|uniref:Pimeloyl-ACP methyl ester carboxylesterase n=1 Tax=Corynebacterium aquatimens TaxID=1190508 RepID=A0A931E205_9CORY|nr:alpha/beta fold hydrolase [Corynebacterium aquatimens]MBG6122110.1 pimeloyl-ACP methyl ester carboxylesterase [Corynebacterium aquatimens]WJY65349.1 Proline iminopeptidase [Corynebacterium aquatimens]
MYSTIIPPNISTREHVLEVPWAREDPSLGNFELFARELFIDDTAPPLLFLQGGPGSPAPRTMLGWIPEALKRHRVFLLDQRGTGRSGKIDATTPELIREEILSRLRSVDVVADAEDLRRALGFEKWDILGNSFGALCAGSYLSYYPDGVGRAYLTGAVPQLGWEIDDYNAKTFDLLETKHLAFYDAVPWAEARIREVCHHLDNSDERMPTGERLSSQRFRFLGVALGEEYGMHALATILEAPFHNRGGEKRLRPDFKAMVGWRVSVETNPLWPVIHETLFGGVQEGPSNWSAERVAAEHEGFHSDADPTGDGKFYLTGNHFFRYHFEEDPALRAFKPVVEKLAARSDWVATFDQQQLVDNTVPTAIELYEPDMFVPFDFAVENAARIGSAVVNTHPTWEHDAMYLHGEEIFPTLAGMLDRAAGA